MGPVSKLLEVEAREVIDININHVCHGLAPNQVRVVYGYSNVAGARAHGWTKVEQCRGNCRGHSGAPQ